jgi:hypothetical protein
MLYGKRIADLGEVIVLVHKTDIDSYGAWLAVIAIDTLACCLGWSKGSDD